MFEPVRVCDICKDEVVRRNTELEEPVVVVPDEVQVPGPAAPRPSGTNCCVCA
jgi:hypothetical protein